MPGRTFQILFCDISIIEDHLKPLKEEVRDALRDGVLDDTGVIEDPRHGLAGGGAAVVVQRQEHEAVEERLAEIPDDPLGDVRHQVGLKELKDPLEEEKDRNGKDGYGEDPQGLDRVEPFAMYYCAPFRVPNLG